jgi:hypothetical protein
MLRAGQQDRTGQLSGVRCCHRQLIDWGSNGKYGRHFDGQMGSFAKREKSRWVCCRVDGQLWGTGGSLCTCVPPLLIKGTR